jgi:hypothetical protein
VMLPELPDARMETRKPIASPSVRQHGAARRAPNFLHHGRAATERQCRR